VPLSSAALGFLLLLHSLPAYGQTSQEVTLAFVGDIMLDELPGEAVLHGDDPFASFTTVLQSADLAVGNLECAITEEGKAADKYFTFRAHPRVLNVLAKYFGALGLANNHSMDFGPNALLQTIQGLNAAKIRSFGAGKNLTDAHRSLSVEIKGIRIAILGYNEFLPRWFEAGADRPGVAWSEDEQILRDIRLARQGGADIVIPVLHWGWENETRPNARQRTLAHRLIDGGASAVVGGHPHVTQGAEVYRNYPIIYSLGNFVFNGFESKAATTGWVLRMTLNKTGVLRWDTVVAVLDQRGLPKIDPSQSSPAGDEFVSARCYSGANR
jgi:poly-gamma-glutamate synthesis protein (capsule biosynthesis protein)